MSRFASLVRHPRRTLATLGTVLAAVGVTVASGADFTAQSANPANTFSTGTLTMTNSADNTALFTASGLRPGAAPSEGIVDIANTGSLTGAFTVNRSTPVDSDTANKLSEKLNATIVDCGTFDGATAPTCGDGDDATLYTGTIAAMGNTSLGNFAGGVKHRYRFRVGLDTSANNNYQGDTSTTTFVWNAA